MAFGALCAFPFLSCCLPWQCPCAISCWFKSLCSDSALHKLLPWPSITETPSTGEGELLNPLCLSHNGWLELAMDIWETTWKRCFYPGNCVATDTSEDNLDHFCRVMILPCTVAQFLLLFCTAWLRMLESLNIFGISCWDGSTWCWPGGHRAVRSCRKPHQFPGTTSRF